MTHMIKTTRDIKLDTINTSLAKTPTQVALMKSINEQLETLKDLALGHLVAKLTGNGVKRKTKSQDFANPNDIIVVTALLLMTQEITLEGRGLIDLDMTEEKEEAQMMEKTIRKEIVKKLKNQKEKGVKMKRKRRSVVVSQKNEKRGRLTNSLD